ncbi:MAG: amino acid permease, partial [Firmicutes bacterium]|nr:amino acid permease [Bacillota bacterium]
MRTQQEKIKTRSNGLLSYLSPMGVWALAFGCSVGWGAFVIPGTNFLPCAGPLGTVLGLGLGVLVMLVISANYHYMLNRYPDAGGTFSYTKRVFGYDHGFLSAWFLALTYIAIIWANITALAVIGRYLLGETLQVGIHYQLGGNDIYLGEALLAVAALVICGLICVYGKRLAAKIQIITAVILFAGIAFCFIS